MDRPLPAERLIREAIDVYSQRKDQLGLAEAYLTYGFFFRTSSVERWKHIYQVQGFFDKEAPYETRFEWSITYFERAEEIFHNRAAFDRLTNVEFNKGVTYALMHQDIKACAAFSASLASRQRASEADPSVRVLLPKGFSSYAALVEDAKRRIACSS